jgi:hypothetical protein
MDPVSIYAVGFLATTLISGAAGVSSVGVGMAGASVGMGAGTIGLTWPVSVPVLAGYGAMKGVEHVLTPRQPGKRELIALNSSTPTDSQYVDCREYPVPVSGIEKVGGHHAFSAGSFPLEKMDSDFLKVIDKNQITTDTNWRAGTVFSGVDDTIPKVVADWVGNDIDADGGEVSNLRVCALKNKTDWGTK